MKKFIAAFFATLVLAGCNTTEGFGEDVEATGEAIEETARKTKEKITD
ncbi:MAG: entericidin A/B family lipoprotein [Pseudomonadota bacterium]